MYFYVSEFDVGVNDSIFSGNEQQKVQYKRWYVKSYCCHSGGRLRQVIFHRDLDPVIMNLLSLIRYVGA